MYAQFIFDTNKYSRHLGMLSISKRTNLRTGKSTYGTGRSTRKLTSASACACALACTITPESHHLWNVVDWREERL
jgi:hypothetical protein